MDDTLSVETRDVALSTGDYAVPADYTHNGKHPSATVRDRMQVRAGLPHRTYVGTRQIHRELQRAAEWPQPLTLVVKTAWETLLRNRGCLT